MKKLIQRDKVLEELYNGIFFLDKDSVSAEDDVPSIYVSDGLLHVGQASSASDVRILTLSGICIKSVSAGSAIDIPLEPGIYIVDVRQTDGNCLLTKKIVVR